MRLMMYAWALFGTLSSLAASFSESIHLGDEHRGHASPEMAIQAFDDGFNLAANDTERGIALSKKAEVYAYDLKNYDLARTVAEESLALKEAGPVAHVTAYQVLAEIRIKKDNDHRAALSLLEKAVKLEGVEWAHPTLYMMLGDCHRATGDFYKALKSYEKITGMPNTSDALLGTAHLNLGITYQYNLNNPSEARKAYDKAIDHRSSLESEVKSHLSRLP